MAFGGKRISWSNPRGEKVCFLVGRGNSFLHTIIIAVAIIEDGLLCKRRGNPDMGGGREGNGRQSFSPPSDFTCKYASELSKERNGTAATRLLCSSEVLT